MHTSQPLGRSVRRSIVGHDHFDRQAGIGRTVSRDALQAWPQERAAIVTSGSPPNRSALDGHDPSPVLDRSRRRLHRPLRFVPRGLAPENMLNGHEQDPQVQPERPALDVVEIVLDPLAQRRAAAPAVDLRPARHSPGDGMPQVVIRHRVPEADQRSWGVPDEAQPGSSHRARRSRAGAARQYSCAAANHRSACSACRDRMPRSVRSRFRRRTACCET